MFPPIDEILSFLTIKAKLSDNTIRHFQSRFKIYRLWLEENHQELSPQSVERFLYELKHKRNLGNNSINTYIGMFRHLYSFYQDREIEIDNFIKDITSLPKDTGAIIILSIAEVEALINSDIEYGKYQGKDCSFLNTVYKVLTQFLAFTGCRYEEAANLRVEHLNLDEGRVLFTKTISKDNRIINTKNRQWRNVYITEPLIGNLRDLTENKKPSDLVFTNMAGNKVLPQLYIDDIKRRALECGITKNVHPHIFRHTYATHLLMAGVDISLIATILGHKDIQTTFKNYIHLADKALKQAAYKFELALKYADPQIIMKYALETVMPYYSLQEKDPRFMINLNMYENGFNFQFFIKSKTTPPITNPVPSPFIPQPGEQFGL